MTDAPAIPDAPLPAESAPAGSVQAAVAPSPGSSPPAAPSVAPAAPAPAPAAEATPPVAASDVAVAPPAPEAAAPPVVEEPKAPDAPKSLLEEFGEDGKPKVEAKPEDKPADVPAVDPATLYADLKLPETFAKDEKFNEFTTLLGGHQIPAESAQKLLDLHTTAMHQYAEKVAQDQHTAFNTLRSDWRKQVMADPELGGSGFKTSMGAIARMRDLFVPEKDRASFNEFLAYTGAGDHPAFLRLLHNAAGRFDEPPLPPPNAKPTPNNSDPRGTRSLYGQPPGRQ